MCGLYYHTSTYLSYQVHLSVCPVFYTCVAFPFKSNFGGGDIKAYFNIVKPKLAHNLGLLGIIGFNISFMCGGINR